MNVEPEFRGTGALVTDALQHLSKLLRGEIALAKAEAGEKLRGIARGATLVAGAVIFALIALFALTFAGIAGLIEAGWSAPIAALAVGLGLAVIAAVLCWAGINALKPRNLAPERTIRSVRRDAETLKEVMKDD